MPVLLNNQEPVFLTDAELTLPVFDALSKAEQATVRWWLKLDLEIEYAPGLKYEQRYRYWHEVQPELRYAHPSHYFIYRLKQQP